MSGKVSGASADPAGGNTVGGNTVGAAGKPRGGGRASRRPRFALWAVGLLALAGLGGCAAVYADYQAAEETWRKDKAALDNRVVFLLYMNEELRGRVAASDAEIARIGVSEADVVRLNQDIAAARQELAELAAERERVRAASRADLARAEAEREKSLASARAAVTRAAAVGKDIAARERRLAKLDKEIAAKRRQAKALTGNVADGRLALAALDSRIAAQRDDLGSIVVRRETATRERRSVEARIATAKLSLDTVNASLLVREERAQGLDALILQARDELDRALKHLRDARRQMRGRNGDAPKFSPAPGGRRTDPKS